MKRLLFAIFLLVGCAHADELQLDHSFGSAFTAQSLAFSPDAKKLAVAGSDGVKIYEVESGKVLETRSVGLMQVETVAWSPDSQALAAGGKTFTRKNVGEIWVWRDGQVPMHWPTGRATIAGLDWSPDSATLASVGGRDFIGEEGNDEACLWEASTGKLKSSLGHFSSVEAAIKFSGDGKAVVFSSSSDSEPETTLCDSATGRVLKAWTDSALPLYLKGQSPLFGEQPLARSSESGFDWSVETTAETREKIRFVARPQQAGGKGAVTNLGVGGECAVFGGNYLAVLTKRPQFIGQVTGISIWKIEGNPPQARFIREIGARTVSPRQLEISGDGRTLAVSTRKGTALFNSQFKNLQILPLQNLQGEQRYSDPVLSLSKDGSQLFDGRWFNLLHGARKEILPFSALDSMQEENVALSPDGEALVGSLGQFSGAGLKRAGKPDVALKLPPLPYNDESGSRRPRSMPFGSAAWSPDGRRFAVAGGDSQDGGLFVFNSKGKFEREMKLRGQRLAWKAVAFSPNGQYLAAAGSSSWPPRRGPLLDIWEAANGKHVLSIDVMKGITPPFPIGEINSVAFSPDGRIIAAGGIDFGDGVFAPRLRFYDAKTGNKIAALPIFSYEKESWVFLGRDHVAVLDGNAIEVWDFHTQRLEKSLSFVPKTGGFSFVENSR